MEPKINESGNKKRIPRSKNQKGINLLAYYTLDHLVKFCNLKELLTGLLLCKSFSLAVQRTSVYGSYLYIRNEFVKKEEKVIPKTNVNADKNQKKYKYFMNLNNLNNETAANPKKKSNEREKIQKKKSIDMDRYTIQELVENNSEIPRRWIQKYKISQGDAVLLFSGLILRLLEKSFGNRNQNNKSANNSKDQNVKISLALKSCNMQSGINYLSHALISYPFFTKFDLSGNLIEKKLMKNLSLSFEKAKKSLCVINLSNNQINDSGAKILFHYLESNNILQFLDLSFNGIGSEGIEGSKIFLQKTTSLQSLNLQNNLIGARGAFILKESLVKNKSIRALNLGYNGIQTEGCKYFQEVFQKNTKIVTLDFSGNYIFDEGLIILVQAMEKHPSICYLLFDWNNITDTGVEQIAHLISYNPSVFSVSLKKNSIEDRGIESLFNAIAWRTRVSSVDLTENKFTQEGVQIMCETLKASKVIGGLCLEGNVINTASCKLIGDMLKVNSTIKNINLSNCLIKGGAKFIIESLEKNTKLSIINLSGNEIGSISDDFFAPIVSCLGNNLFLKELILDDNQINDTDMIHICEGLKSNRNISIVSLRGNLITGKISSLLLAAITSSGHLHQIHLEKNLIDSISLKTIDTALRKNRNTDLMTNLVMHHVNNLVNKSQENSK